MGDRYPTNEHGIHSASLYCVYGCWLRRLVGLAVIARWLLVGDTREASATSAVGRDHFGPYPYVFAGSLCSIMIHYERQTYENWLSQPGLILDALGKHFRRERCHFRWGKIYFAGRKRSC